VRLIVFDSYHDTIVVMISKLLSIVKVIVLLSLSSNFAVSKDEWDTIRGTGKSMKNALHVQQYSVCQKAPLWLKQH